MKRLSLALVFLLLAVPAFASKPTKDFLAAPILGETCSTEPNEDNVTTLSWLAVDGAGRYSVEVTAGYDLSGEDGCPDAYFNYEYEALTTSIDVDLDELDVCTAYDEIETSTCVAWASPVEASFRVKALNPPSKGKNKSQNNPFSAPCSILSPEECLD